MESKSLHSVVSAVELRLGVVLRISSAPHDIADSKHTFPELRTIADKVECDVKNGNSNSNQKIN